MKSIFLLILCIFFTINPKYSVAGLTDELNAGLTLEQIIEANKSDAPLGRNVNSKKFSIEDIVKILEEQKSPDGFTVNDVVEALKNYSDD